MLLEPEPRDEQKVKDFMIQKYERKRWFVEPDKAVRNMQDHNLVEDHSHLSGLQSAAGSSGPSSQSSTPLSEHMPETKSLSNLLGRNALPLVVQNSPAQLVRCVFIYILIYTSPIFFFHHFLSLIMKKIPSLTFPLFETARYIELP